jgi:hypothetical protein
MSKPYGGKKPRPLPRVRSKDPLRSMGGPMVAAGSSSPSPNPGDPYPPHEPVNPNPIGDPKPKIA